MQSHRGLTGFRMLCTFGGEMGMVELGRSRSSAAGGVGGGAPLLVSHALRCVPKSTAETLGLQDGKLKMPKLDSSTTHLHNLVLRDALNFTPRMQVPNNHILSKILTCISTILKPST